MLFGRNPYEAVLRRILKLDCEGGYSSGRFRDIYVNADGTEIILYTRNGGGNRECLVYVNERLTQHPNYIKDYDDDFDCTYAYFHFSVPEEYLLITKVMATGKDPESVTDRFEVLINEMKSMSKEALSRDKRFKPIAEALQKLMNVSEEENHLDTE